jgi:hypothetical protein
MASLKKKSFASHLVGFGGQVNSLAGQRRCTLHDSGRMIHSLFFII